jgi:2-C-methyl-D-erythritol 2,4-cyclodiphosphate synthase
MASPTIIRIGLGHDTHRLGPGTGLVIGGITIPHERQALGHSDADVLLHAITDALLGAAALGDIGELFPDTDPANKGRNSAEMLRVAADRVTAAGWRVVNLDCVIFAQRPKILPYRPRILSRIAEILEIDLEAVWLKAKTGEGVGPIGTEEAIAAECVVLLERIEHA